MIKRLWFLFFNCLLVYTCAYAMELPCNNTITTTQISQEIKESYEHLLAKFDQIKCIKTDNSTFWLSPIKDPLFNMLSSFSPTTEQAAIAVIDAIITKVKQNQSPFYWPILDEAYKEIVKEKLESNGFQKKDFNEMIFFMENINAHNTVSDVIRPLVLNNIREWMEVLNNSFGEEDYLATQAYHKVIEKDLKQTSSDSFRTEYYSGYLNDNLVSIGSLFISDNYAEIGNIATHEKARNKGMATLMITALLQRAKNLNLHHVILGTHSSVAQKIYEKIGFKVIMNFEEFHYTIQ